MTLILIHCHSLIVKVKGVSAIKTTSDITIYLELESDGTSGIAWGLIDTFFVLVLDGEGVLAIVDEQKALSGEELRIIVIN